MGKESPESWKRRNERKAKWKREIDPTTVPPTIKRICKVCGKLKECGWRYSFSQTGKPEYNTRCINCFKIYSTEKQRNRSQSRNLYRKQKMIEERKKQLNILVGHVQRVAIRSLASLTFHHNKDEKDKTVGSMLDWSWDKLKKELDKCDLLCFNCHMELHAEENGHSAMESS